MRGSRLLAWLRCPECRHSLDPTALDILRCGGCGREYVSRDGVQRFVGAATPTARAFGYMWGRHAAVVTPTSAPRPYHLHRLYEALGTPRFSGLILDGGCGDGVDLATLALDPGCEVVGLELSDGGVATSVARTAGLARAHVVQGDVMKMPLADDLFDGVYSYGVVHHTPDPPRAVRELARVLKPGASLLLYVYEDFSDRSWSWRFALGAVNTLRYVTTRCPPPVLMGLCRFFSPVVYLTCTIPSRHCRWARRFPYRHNRHAWSLVGDLYDRFAAAIEHRYSETGARKLAEDAGLVVRRVAQHRGWMVWAVKLSEEGGP